MLVAVSHMCARDEPVRVCAHDALPDWGGGACMAADVQHVAVVWAPRITSGSTIGSCCTSQSVLALTL